MKPTRLILHLCAAVCCLAGSLALAQIPAPTAPPPGVRPTPTPPPSVAPGPSNAPAATTAAPAPGSNKNLIGFTTTPLSDVLSEYYRVTGRRVLKDRGLENATVTIEVPGEFGPEEYRSIIEKGLLMHGFALVPSGDNLDKLVAAEQGTTPSTQNVPMILNADALPMTDQVVTHVLELTHLGADEASTAFQQIIPLHPYGKILAVPNVRALVITEASQTIRAYIELAKRVDQPPQETVQKTIKIERADAEEVAEQLGSLLGIGSGSSGGSSSRRNAAAPGGAPPVAANPAGGAAGGSSSLGGGGSPDSVKPVLQAIPRTNSILAVARPIDMQKIEALVHELDAEPSTSRYISRKLNYLDLSVFLSIAEKALQRNDLKDANNSLSSQLNSQQNTTIPTNNTQQNTFGSGLGGMGSGLNSGLGGMGSGMSGSGSSSFGANSSPLQVTKKPISILIANTLVIADPASSKFFASGPPDQIKALQDLAEELDVRPKQIMLSAIIGEFTLGDNFNFGLDWIQSLKQAGEDGLVGGVLNTQGTAFANPSNLKDIAGFLGAGNPAALSGLTAYGQINKNLNVFLQTLETSKRFHVLQKPTLTTLNHQSASIYIGQQVAIAGQSYTNGVVGGGFSSTTQYIPVRLQLDITPHIFNDTEVMLEFKQQNNGLGDYTTIGGNRVPNINEQGMTNSLIVPDHATAMLGGLITERDTHNKSGLPFLVRIPVIKHLFGSTNNTKERREMIIFVQPRIMPDTSSQMLEQARMGDGSANFDQAAGFGGMPETIVPRALPVDAKPGATPSPSPSNTGEPKKGLLNRMKGWFQKPKNPQP